MRNVEPLIPEPHSQSIKVALATLIAILQKNLEMAEGDYEKGFWFSRMKEIEATFTWLSKRTTK